MKTDYAGHDEIYQQRRNDPEFSGWQSQKEAIEDWELLWQPLAKKLNLAPPAKILELGCGAGNIGIEFAKLGHDVTGVDIAPTAIAWAVENAKKANVSASFLGEDVLKLPSFKDSTFDLVIDGHCFHCIIGTDRTRFLEAAIRVLKPNGVLLLSTMCNSIPEIIAKQFDPVTRCTFRGGIATRYIGLSNNIIKEIIAAGFEIQFLEVKAPTDVGDCNDLQLIATRIA